MFSSYDGLCTIGELAEHAGVSVKTVRFYSDRGLLPEASRSVGGHRRYAPEAVERLGMIRSLRGLDVSVPEVRRILDEQDDGPGAGGALEDAVAGRLRTLGSELAALRWREAALRLVQESPPPNGQGGCGWSVRSPHRRALPRWPVSGVRGCRPACQPGPSPHSWRLRCRIRPRPPARTRCSPSPGCTPT